MGVEDRDWYREDTSPPRRGWRWRTPAVLIVVGVVAGLLLAGWVHKMAEGSPAMYEGNPETRSGDTKISILPGLPEITLHGDPLVASDDPWRAYLADEKSCPGSERTDLPLIGQADTMVCLVNFARRQRQLHRVATVAVLNASSLAKASEIVRCRHFAHEPCGEDAAADAREAGYGGAWGENLYIAEGRFGAPLAAIDGWLNSPGHRANLFRPEWRTQGLAVQKLDRFGNERDVTLWVNHFGTD